MLQGCLLLIFILTIILTFFGDYIAFIVGPLFIFAMTYIIWGGFIFRLRAKKIEATTVDYEIRESTYGGGGPLYKLTVEYPISPHKQIRSTLGWRSAGLIKTKPKEKIWIYYNPKNPTEITTNNAWWFNLAVFCGWILSIYLVLHGFGFI